MITINSRICHYAHLLVPWRGRWFIDVKIEGEAPSGRATISWGSASFVGTVHPEFTGTFLDDASVRVVGGIGWSTKLKTLGGWMHNDAGLHCLSVAQSLARVVGETLVGEAGAFRQGRVSHARGASFASVALDNLLAPGQAWWVDATGVTRAGARPDVALGPGVELLEYAPERRRARLLAPDPDAVPIGGILAASSRSPRLRVTELFAVADGDGEQYNVSVEVVS